MIQVLPQPYDPMSSLGQAIGQGLQSGMSDSLQYNTNRQRLEQAFQPLQNLTQEQMANMSLPQLLSTYAKALLPAPGGAQAFAELIQPLTQQYTRARTPTASSLGDYLNQGAGKFNKNLSLMNQARTITSDSSTAANPGLMMQPSLAQQNPPAASTIKVEAPKVESPESAAQPTPGTSTQPLHLGSFLGAYVPDIIQPEQEAAIIDAVYKSGGDVDYTKQQIKAYNEGKIAIDKLRDIDVERQAASRERALNFENQISDFIDKQLGNTIPPREKNILHNMVSKEAGKTKDLTTAYRRVEKPFRDFLKEKDNYIAAIPDPTFAGLSNDAEGQLRSGAQNLMKTDPLSKDILQEAYEAKGHSVFQSDQILNPLPSDIRSILKNTEDFNPLLYPKHDVSDRQMLNNITMADKDQAKQVDKLAKELKPKFKPETSLVNVYLDLYLKGWLPHNIFKLFDQLEAEGIEFSSSQNVQKTKLLESPQKGGVNKIPMRYIWERND